MAGSTSMFCFHEVGQEDRGFEVRVQALGLAWSLGPLLPVVGGGGGAKGMCCPLRPGAAGDTRREVRRMVF